MSTGFNTIPHCSRTTDPDMILGSSLGLEVTMTLGGSTVHPAWHGLVAAHPSDTKKAAGGRADPMNLHGPLGTKPRISAQTLAD